MQLARWEYGRVRARQWLRNACRVDPGGAAIGFFYRDTAAHSELDASFSAKAAFSGERLGTLREGRRGGGPVPAPTGVGQRPGPRKGSHELVRVRSRQQFSGRSCRPRPR